MSAASSSVVDQPQDKPTDLSMKSSNTNHKKRFIPPPLDLNARTFEAEPTSESTRVPKSPGDLPRECLPIRKRHLVESGRNSAFHSKSPKSAGPGDSIFSTLRFSTPTSTGSASGAPVDLSSSTNGSHTAPNSPIVTAFGPLNSSLSLTPSSATSVANNQAFTHFPVPPPLIPVPPGSGNAVAAVAMAAMANAFNSSKTKAASVSSSSGFPTPPTDVHSPYAWAHSPAALAAAAAGSPFSPLPLSPFPTVTSLLSPTASHPSSVSSSREDLQATMEREILKRRILPPPAVGTYDTPASPLWSFGGAPPASLPNPVWQCFHIGTRIKFLLANTDAPWQKAEELAWKDHVAMKIDARNSYQYAPNGLVLVQADDLKPSANTEDSRKSDVILFRFTPAHLSGAPDILVEAPITHPFLVKDKGWCSMSPTLTSTHYGIRCQELSTGDICLPPNHPDAIRTPDLCDRFKRFEFTSSTTETESPRAIQGTAFAFHPTSLVPPPPTSVGHTLGHIPSLHLKGSPPPPSPSSNVQGVNSPAKSKKEKDCDKPKRPMNGFMLFAKKYRLELIQQHPGKDNRAISVLLGEAWKSLPLEEREGYSTKAKLLADEQKKIHPDCWKRKKTVANNHVTTTGEKPTMPTTPTTLLGPEVHHQLTGSRPEVDQLVTVTTTTAAQRVECVPDIV